MRDDGNVTGEVDFFAAMRFSDALVGIFHVPRRAAAAFMVLFADETAATLQ